MSKKIIGMLAIAGLVLGNTQVWAVDNWEFLPVKNDGFNSDMTLSFMGGITDPLPHGLDADLSFGLELSMNCLLLDPPQGIIRQQFSYMHYDDGGLTITSFELNPHYLYRVDDKFSIGIGPGIGYVDADGRDINEGALAIQGGVSLHYNMSQRLFLGAEARYQWTQELDDSHDDLKNTRIFGKVGYRF